MLESLLLPAAILLATVAAGILAAVSVAAARPPGPAAPAVGVPVHLRCPITQDWAHVRLAVDLVARSVAVVSCERFGDGLPKCGRTCFPTQALEAVA